jgi:predicted acylesterase/phospholipase RssA
VCINCAHLTSGRSLDIFASTRKHFLAAVGAAATAAPIPALATAAIPAADFADSRKRVISDALVLGGARGAFQAGIICALAERGGISDGEPLHPYGLVCGSSIGALNSWFVSTAQYAALRKAWATLAGANVFELKRKYAAIMEPHAFAGDRLYEYMHFALAASEHEQAMGQSAPILKWMQEHMDPRTPVVTPMVWAVTNMTTQSGEYFYRLPASMSGRIPGGIAHALEVTLGAETVIRPAGDDILHRAILASAAIPVVFDPVVLPMIDGTHGVYVDGSIASNAAVSVARTVARNVDVILVDAKSGRTEYKDAIAIAFGAYGTMQREVLETAMRNIYFETLEEHSHAPAYGDIPSGRIRYVRPEAPLAPGINAFNEQNVLDAMFALGEQAAKAGFSPYVWQTFHL